MRTIYRNSPVPRYHQLKEILREKVSTEEWKPGDLIPSERELSETYSISRMTARQAITDLVNEGLFYREQGRGTFVADNRITQQLLQLTGFTEDIQARGQRPSTIVLSAAMHPSRRHRGAAAAHRAGADGLPSAPSAPGGRGAAGHRGVLLNFKGCEALAEEDFENHSLYQLLETQYGIPLMEAQQEIEAGLAGQAESETLRIPVGSPVLLTRRTTYTDRNRPVEYARSVYCGAKYTFFTHLKRDRLFS